MRGSPGVITNTGGAPCRLPAAWERLFAGPAAQRPAWILERPPGLQVPTATSPGDTPRKNAPGRSAVHAAPHHASASRTGLGRVFARFSQSQQEGGTMKDRTALGDHAAAIGGTRPSMAERAAAVLAWAGQPRQATPMRAARPLPCTVSRTPGRVICTTSTGAVRPVPASLNTTVCAAVAQAPAVWDSRARKTSAAACARSSTSKPPSISPTAPAKAVSGIATPTWGCRAKGSAP